MKPLTRQLFLWLIVAQAAHSVEEYLSRLYDVLAPARWGWRVPVLYGPLQMHGGLAPPRFRWRAPHRAG